MSNDKRFGNWLAGCGLVACACASAGADQGSQDDAKSAAQAVVRAALEFGIAGDAVQRTAGLVEALALDPDCQLARWHLGQLQWADRWVSLSEAERALARDDCHQAYVTRRDALQGDPADELALARWCSAQQLDEQAEFHYRQVLVNSASSERLREESRKGLGLRWFNGDWYTEGQIEQQQQQAAARQRAENKWAKLVQRWTKGVQRGQTRQIEFVRQQMSEVEDVEIIPVLERHMSAAGEKPAGEVVAWLGERRQIEATESLLRHALNAPWPGVQETAIESLESRPVHDYVPPLLGQLMPLIESRYSIRVSPLGGVLHQHQLFRAGQRENDLLQSDFFAAAWRPVFAVSRQTPPGRSISVRRLGRDRADPPTVAEQAQEVAEIRQRTQLLAAQATVRTAQIEQQVALVNQQAAQHNRRIYPVLEGATEARVAQRPELWWDWWETYNEQYSPPENTRYWYTTRTQYYGPAYEASLRPRCECFVAGTLVRTDTGLVPIEQIQPGHRVLSQHVDTGQLSYKVVTATTERPEAPLLRIKAGDLSVVATTGHPFWVNGKGWRMAKRLVVGDVLHTLSGPVSIDEIGDAETTAAYNLIVKDFNAYFVGDLGVLVHDNNPRQPTLAMTPGLIVD